MESCHPEALPLGEGSSEMRGMEMDLKGSLATLLSHLGQEPKKSKMSSRTFREILRATEALQDDSSRPLPSEHREEGLKPVAPQVLLKASASARSALDRE